MKTLPSSWALLPIAAIAKSALGKMLDRTKHRKGRSLPYLRNQNVRWFEVDTSDLQMMFFEEDELERFGLRAGDVLVCEGGEPGRAAIWTGDPVEMKYQKALHRIRTSEVVIPKWLVFHFKHDADRGALSDYFTGSTIKHFTGASLAKYEIAVPPVQEQRRILAKLESLHARSRRAWAALDALPWLTDKLRQSILASAFRGDLTADWRANHPNAETGAARLDRIRTERRARWEATELARLTAKGRPPSDDKWKAKYVEPLNASATVRQTLPSTWTWGTLEELTRATHPICYGVVQPGEDTGDGVRLIRVCDLAGDGFTIDEHSLRSIPAEVDEEHSRSRLEGGEVLVSVVGTIGRTAIAPASLRGANIARAIARLSFDRPWLAEWCTFWLNTGHMSEFLNRESREVARKTLNIAQLASVEMPVLSEAEAAAALSRLRATFRVIAKLGTTAQFAAEHLSDYERSLLAKAFRGHLVPQNPDDEPAATMFARLRSEQPRVGEATKPSRDAAEMTRTRRSQRREEAHSLQETKTTSPQSLADLLRSSGGRLSPERLLSLSGLEEEIDVFYDQLKHAVAERLIREVRGAHREAPRLLEVVR